MAFYFKLRFFYVDIYTLMYVSDLLWNNTVYHNIS